MWLIVIPQRDSDLVLSYLMLMRRRWMRAELLAIRSVYVHSKGTNTRMLLLETAEPDPDQPQSQTCIRRCLHWDVNELHEVPNESHDCEPDSDGSTELDVFYGTKA